MRDQRLILLVDDDAFVRQLVRRRLQAAGYRVDEVDNGETALDVMRALRPDLVLLDVMMQGTNGLEVCAQIKCDPQLADTPVLFLSAAGDTPTRVAGLELGAQDFITKSTDLRELQVRIKTALSVKMEREELREAAVRLENEMQRLQAEVLVDPLTGLYNRRALMHAGNAALEEAMRDHAPLSIWMLDVDHFKRVNDTWGHSVGDQVLRRLAEEMRRSLRDADACGRFGGEEFAVVMPNTGLEAAAWAAERVRAAIEAIHFQVGEEVFQVTVSIGLATYPAEGATLLKLVDLADRRLYAAKQAGRNRVVSRSIPPFEMAIEPPHHR